MQVCRTCGGRLDETTQPLPTAHCPWCGALITLAADTPTTHPAAPDQPQKLQYQGHQRRRPARWLRGAPGLGVLMLCVALLSFLLYALVRSGGFRVVVAPSASSNSSAFSNSNASANSNASSGAPTAPVSGGKPPSTTRTPATSPSPARSLTATASPTATPLPPILEVVPTTIQLSPCVAGQTTFTVANTGAASFSWTAKASVMSYSLSPSSGTLDGGGQTVVTVSLIVLVSGTITVTAANARNSPQDVTITCTV
jgi:hypothetical protein